MRPESGVRVLVVDDSAHARQVVKQIVAEDPRVAEVVTAGNGRIALAKALKLPPDLVILDLAMPEMDGFEFLRLFRARSNTPVLVLSGLSELENVEKTLELGANGFIAKPANPYRNMATIVEELRLKVGMQLEVKLPPAALVVPPDAPVVVIGASSGGPSSLQYLLTGLPAGSPLTVVIAQHMPRGFTEALATRLDGLLPLPVRELASGDRLQPGGVYFAPGGSDLTLERGGTAVTARVEPAPQRPYAPSVDLLFASAARVYGSRLTAVVLTGMGRDGAAGVPTVKAHGGTVLAESEETAVIYGMPREAVATGRVDAVLPLPEIAVRLIHLATRLPERRADLRAAPDDDRVCTASGGLAPGPG